MQLLQNWAEAKHLHRENVLIAIMCSSLIDKELREQQHNSMQSQYLARQKALCVADRCRTIILFREYIIKENQLLSQKNARFQQINLSLPNTCISFLCNFSKLQLKNSSTCSI